MLPEPCFELLLFWSPDCSISRRQQPGLAGEERPILICQKAKERPLQPLGGGGLTKTEGRKKGKKEWSVGERVLERERKLPDKHTAVPQLLITLRFRFQTL